MGTIFYLKHIISNKSKQIDIGFVNKLYATMSAKDTLRSDIYYRFHKNCLELEYYAKSVSPFIYENPLLENEEIVTMHSHEFGDIRCVVTKNDLEEYLFHGKTVHYEYDRIEIEGDPDELNIFLSNLHRNKITYIKSNRLVQAGNGTMILDASDHDFYFSSSYPHYKVIEKIPSKNNPIECSRFDVISLSNPDSLWSRKFTECLDELLEHPEYYDYGIESVKFYCAGSVLLMVQYEKENSEWKFYQHNDLLQYAANKELVLTLDKIGYYH